MKTRWQTDKIVEALKKALPNNSVTVDMPGGDYDSENIIVGVPRAGRFFICGFNTDRTSPVDPGNFEVECVELTDGESSRGGLNSNHSNMIDAYASIRKVLAKLGFNIVPRMKDYF